MMHEGRPFPCRFCGATVRWNPGIKRPVNDASRYMVEEAGGADYGFTPDGRQVRGRFLASPAGPGAKFIVRDVHCCPQFKKQNWQPEAEPEAAAKPKPKVIDGDLFGGKESNDGEGARDACREREKPRQQDGAAVPPAAGPGGPLDRG